MNRKDDQDGKKARRKGRASNQEDDRQMPRRSCAQYATHKTMTRGKSEAEKRKGSNTRGRRPGGAKLNNCTITPKAERVLASKKQKESGNEMRRSTAKMPTRHVKAAKLNTRDLKDWTRRYIAYNNVAKTKAAEVQRSITELRRKTTVQAEKEEARTTAASEVTAERVCSTTKEIDVDAKITWRSTSTATRGVALQWNARRKPLGMPRRLDKQSNLKYGDRCQKSEKKILPVLAGQTKDRMPGQERPRQLRDAGGVERPNSSEDHDDKPIITANQRKQTKQPQPLLSLWLPSSTPPISISYMSSSLCFASNTSSSPVLLGGKRKRGIEAGRGDQYVGGRRHKRRPEANVLTINRA
ncbi:hypothetical protein C8R45DRAFT_1181376 [Mycena sanguinolenta]|nr:hypothetical protein C8R45DRAFT_1181376 [Mycena sanguinolenta]